MDGWAPLLAEWANTRVIHYIETRENARQILVSHSQDDFQMDDMQRICESSPMRLDWAQMSFGLDLRWRHSNLARIARRGT